MLDFLDAFGGGGDDDAPAVPFPRESAMRSHIAWLVTPARATHSDLRFEIAWGRPDIGPNCGKTFALDEIDKAASFASWINRQGCNVYLGVTLKAADTPAKGRTRASDAALATAVAIDFDERFIDGARRLDALLRGALLVETGSTPEPRAQVWLRVEPTNDLDSWDEANRRAVAFTGTGDKKALGRYRLMRLAGGVSHPSASKRSRGYHIETTKLHRRRAPSYDIRSIIDALPPAPKTLDDVQRAQNSYVPRTARPIPLNRANVALVMQMLAALPSQYASEFDLWLRVGFTLHEFHNGDIGLALWRKFSGRCAAKAAETNFDKAWSSFARDYDGRRLTIGWLVSTAEAYGYRMPRAWDFKTTIQTSEGEQ